MTLSRGRPGRFDLEVWNGAWRGGGEDNLDVSCTGRIPVPDAPEWTRSSLPHEQITAAADQRPHPVAVNTEVAEVPAGGDETVWCPDGPTEGSSARSGGGGDYLSNEIAYRNTLLRDRSGQQVPAGHVHLPLVGGPDEEPEESAAVLAQVRLIVAAVAADAARTREWGSARAKG